MIFLELVIIFLIQKIMTKNFFKKILSFNKPAYILCSNTFFFKFFIELFHLNFLQQQWNFYLQNYWKFLQPWGYLLTHIFKYFSPDLSTNVSCFLVNHIGTIYKTYF